MTNEEERNSADREREPAAAAEPGEREPTADAAGDELHAQSQGQPQPDPPAGVVDPRLRDALGGMRAEADRIASLGTGQEQVEAAERFADDAGRLDEEVGSAARDADDGRG